MVRKFRSLAYLCVASTIVGGQFDLSAYAASAKANMSSSFADSQKFQEFHDGLVEISKLRLDRPENVKRAQAFLVTPPDDRLSHGWLMSLAQAAAMSPEFASGVKLAAKEAGDSAKFGAALAENPNAVLDIDGASTAKKEILSAIVRDIALMNALTFRLNEIAYGRTGREAELSLQAQRQDTAQGVTGAIGKSSMSPKATPLVSQILALSAVTQLNSSAGRAPLSVTHLAANQENDQCMRWARINLAQCLAAARDVQERSYCLAQHGLDERAKCWSWVAQPGT